MYLLQFNTNYYWFESIWMRCRNTKNKNRQQTELTVNESLVSSEQWACILKSEACNIIVFHLTTQIY